MTIHDHEGQRDALPVHPAPTPGPAPHPPAGIAPPARARLALVPTPPPGGFRPSLVPMLAVDDPIPPEVDRALATAARAAQAGDLDARDALYRALEPKLRRLARRHAGGGAFGPGPLRDGRPWDAEDLTQETFCLLADLIGEWNGEGPFAPFVLTFLPWRLRDARRRLDAPRRAEVRLDPDAADLLADGTTAAAEARARLAAIAADLPALDGALLLGVVGDGDRLAEVAGRLGVSRRTASRRWRAVRADLRRSLVEPSPDGVVDRDP